MNQYFYAPEVKKMRDKIEDFSSMAGEIVHIFNNIDSITINNIDLMEYKTTGLSELNNLLIKPQYLTITINNNSEKAFDKEDIIIDLLQSALSESGIVEKNRGIHSTLKHFLTHNTINSIHPMLGSTKEDFISKFDNFIESEKNYELTFRQKLNKLK
jgi:hypothetical protein